MSESEKSSTGKLHASSRTRSLELLGLYKAESPQHCVQFYDDELSVVQNVAYLVRKALDAGGACVIVATQAHLQAIEERLAASDLELNAVREDRRYQALDAAAILEELLTDGLPDKAKFERVVGGILRSAAQASANGFVFAFGEMVALLCASRKPDGAVQLERLWNSLANEHRFSLYCAYPLDSFTGGSADVNAFFEICSQHTLTIRAETHSKTRLPS
jgi:hypothetical protein